MIEELNRLQASLAETERMWRWEKQRRQMAESRLHRMTCANCHWLKRFFCVVSCPIGG